MQWQCLLLCGVVSACRPSLTKEYGPKCTEAIKARAANANTTYEQKLDAYDAFHDACHYACSGNDRSDFCAESYLLAADLDSPASSSLVLAFCEQYKHATSCSWLAANPEGKALADEYNAARQKCIEEDTGQEAKPASCYFGRGWSAHTTETESAAVSSTATPRGPQTMEELVNTARGVFEGQRGFKLAARETVVIPASGSFPQDVLLYPNRTYQAVVLTLGDTYVDAEVSTVGGDMRETFSERKSVDGANYVMGQFKIDGSLYSYNATVRISGRSEKNDTGVLLVFEKR